MCCFYSTKINFFFFLKPEKFQETVDHLAKAFKEKDYDRAKELTIELQYWQSIQSAIHEWHP